MAESGTVIDATSRSRAIRLRDIQFSDLYLPYDGQLQNAFMRAQNGPSRQKGSLDEITEDLKPDLTDFHQAILEKQQEVIRQGRRGNEFFVDFDGYRYRCSRIDDITDTWFVLRRLMYPLPNLTDLQFRREVVQALSKLGLQSGLVLISGATGSGKTTTIASLLKHYLERYGDVGVSLEQPPETSVTGTYGDDGRGKCFQIDVGNEDFSDKMVEAVRYNPRYIMLGEIRAPADAVEAVRAAVNGHVVLTTIHAGSVSQAINSLIQMAARRESQDLIQSNLSMGLAAVMHQALYPDDQARFGHRLRLTSLFIGRDPATRKTIRDGNVENLNNEMHRQRQRMRDGKLPTDL